MVQCAGRGPSRNPGEAHPAVPGRRSKPPRRLITIFGLGGDDVFPWNCPSARTGGLFFRFMDRVCSMPIYRLLLNDATFEPEVTRMGEVYEDVLRSLGLVDRTDPLTELIARMVIQLAHSGERDPVRLKARTLQEFNVTP
jgi:hypothetical protein